MTGRPSTGIPTTAAPAGPAAPPALSGAPRPSIPVEVIAERAQSWHLARLGKACECTEAGRYPCPDCRQEICDLIELLDGVVRDTIRVVTIALERLR